MAPSSIRSPFGWWLYIWSAIHAYRRDPNAPFRHQLSPNIIYLIISHLYPRAISVCVVCHVFVYWFAWCFFHHQASVLRSIYTCWRNTADRVSWCAPAATVRSWWGYAAPSHHGHAAVVRLYRGSVGVYMSSGLITPCVEFATRAPGWFGLKLYTPRTLCMYIFIEIRFKLSECNLDVIACIYIHVWRIDMVWLGFFLYIRFGVRH